MDSELRSWLLELAADVKDRGAKLGDINRDTLVAAYCHLQPGNSHPNLGYVRRIVGNALGKY